MKPVRRVIGLFLLGVGSLLAGAGCQARAGGAGGTASREVARELPLLGHRNWVVIADSAYPCQSRSGVATLATTQDQLALVQGILSEIDHTRHVRARVFLDAELPHVPEADAPGIEAYRRQLDGLLRGRPVESLPHEQIISMLDQAGEEFRVLIVKSNMTLPYTSVFVRLECGYWNDDAERRLRQSLPQTQPAARPAPAVDATQPAARAPAGRKFSVEEFAQVDPEMARLLKERNDEQIRSDTLLAQLGPNNPGALNARTQLQARVAATEKYADGLNARFVIQWKPDGNGGALVPKEPGEDRATK